MGNQTPVATGERGWEHQLDVLLRTAKRLDGTHIDKRAYDALLSLAVTVQSGACVKQEHLETLTQRIETIRRATRAPEIAVVRFASTYDDMTEDELHKAARSNPTTVLNLRGATIAGGGRIWALPTLKARTITNGGRIQTQTERDKDEPIIAEAVRKTTQANIVSVVKDDDPLIATVHASLTGRTHENSARRTVVEIPIWALARNASRRNEQIRAWYPLCFDTDEEGVRLDPESTAPRGHDDDPLQADALKTTLRISRKQMVARYERMLENCDVETPMWWMSEKKKRIHTGPSQAIKADDMRIPEELTENFAILVGAIKRTRAYTLIRTIEPRPTLRELLCISKNPKRMELIAHSPELAYDLLKRGNETKSDEALDALWADVDTDRGAKRIARGCSPEIVRRRLHPAKASRQRLAAQAAAAGHTLDKTQNRWMSANPDPRIGTQRARTRTTLWQKHLARELREHDEKRYEGMIAQKPEAFAKALGAGAWLLECLGHLPSEPSDDASERPVEPTTSHYDKIKEAARLETAQRATLVGTQRHERPGQCVSAAWMAKTLMRSGFGEADRDGSVLAKDTLRDFVEMGIEPQIGEDALWCASQWDPHTLMGRLHGEYPMRDLTVALADNVVRRWMEIVAGIQSVRDAFPSATALASPNGAGRIGDIAEWSRRWHHEIQTTTATGEHDDGALPEPTVISSARTTLPTRWERIENTQMLELVGREEKHCINSYRKSLETGNNHAFILPPDPNSEGRRAVAMIQEHVNDANGTVWHYTLEGIAQARNQPASDTQRKAATDATKQWNKLVQEQPLMIDPRQLKLRRTAQGAIPNLEECRAYWDEVLLATAPEWMTPLHPDKGGVRHILNESTPAWRRMMAGARTVVSITHTTSEGLLRTLADYTE